MELTEHPDVNMVREYASHEDVWKEYRPQLQRLSQKVSSDGSLTVKYARKDGARFYASNQGISATTMWGEIRSGIYGRRDIDVDIVNCHPSILLQLMRQRLKEDDDLLQLLTDYVRNRDECLKRQDLPKRWAKGLVCGVMNGLNINKLDGSSWAKSRDNEDFFRAYPDWKPCEWWQRLSSDCVAFRNILESDLNVKKLAKKYGWKSPTAMYLQHIETEHMLSVKAELEKRGVIWSAYCYDGFQTHRSNRAKVDQWVAEGCPCGSKWNLRFIVKPWKPMLRRNPYRFDWNKFARMCQWHGKTDPTEEQLKTLLSRAKEYWEAHWFLLDTGVLVKQTGRDTYVLYRNNGRDIARLRGIKVCFYDGLGKLHQKQWLEHWAGSHRPRCYPDFKYEPPHSEVDPTKADYKEQWCGWAIEHTLPADPVPSTRVIHDHLRYVGEDCEKGYTFLLRLVAHYVQFPGRPSGVCPLVLGEQGSGKSGFFEALMGGIMGKSKILASENVNDILGRFNRRALKHVVMADEISGIDTHGKQADAWKRIISPTGPAATSRSTALTTCTALFPSLMHRTRPRCSQPRRSAACSSSSQRV